MTLSTKPVCDYLVSEITAATHELQVIVSALPHDIAAALIGNKPCVLVDIPDIEVEHDLSGVNGAFIYAPTVHIIAPITDDYNRAWNVLDGVLGALTDVIYIDTIKPAQYAIPGGANPYPAFTVTGNSTRFYHD